ncbi:uncharacterized protein DS421_10g290930 [Arachis hypogaea]|nr:uncharacterized protein DS421_10g290930 [Arachis hypogaea]
MPQHNRLFTEGCLYIKFNVRVGIPFPLQYRLLETILPQKSSKQLTDTELDECEETTLHDVNMKNEMRRKQQ